MKKILWILTLFASCNAAVAQLNRAGQASEITSNIYTNTNHSITGNILQSVLISGNNSWVNLQTDTNLLGLRFFSQYATYTPGMCAIWGDSLFYSDTIFHGTWKKRNWTKLIGMNQSWGLTGNSGLTAPTNYIGTNDYTDLYFMANAEQSGLINIGNENTGFGYCTMTNEGNNNTGIGAYSLNAVQSMSNNNTAVGSNSLLSNTNGYNNTAVGANSLFSNTNGYNNTALGVVAGQSNIAGYGNVSVGAYAVPYATSGNYNTCLGAYTGNQFTSASGNVMIGAGCGWDLSEGYKNIWIGGNTYNSSGTSVDNSISIGTENAISASNQFLCGDAEITETMLYGAISPGSVGNDGTTGQVLTSQGSGTSPIWAANAIVYTFDTPLSSATFNIPAGDFTGSVIYVSTYTGIAVNIIGTLPSPALVPRGTPLIIKYAASSLASTFQLAPHAGELIDGISGNASLPVTGTSPQPCFTVLTSDNINWITIH